MVLATERFQYYQNLAKYYDRDRFENNSYGRFLNIEEKEILSKLMVEKKGKRVLNAACGTGRFMEFCTDGLDISPNMIQIAARKYSDKTFRVMSCQDTYYANCSFDTILSMHFIMHQSNKETDDFVDECYRILKPGGRLIMDFPSLKRRFLSPYKRKGWHGQNAYRLEDLKERYGHAFSFKGVSGFMFFPVHRIPSFARKLFLKADQWLCKSIFKEYSSYLLVEMKKK